MSHRDFLCFATCIFTIFKFLIAADTLSASQTIVDGDVLTSPSQMFELGFFNPGSSQNRFLGVWFKATPEVVVWIANTQKPIIGRNGVLHLAPNGSLFLSSLQGGTNTIIWSSNSSMAASSPVLQLLDTGNLVVVEKSMNIWQSFDYPGNTRLPGMKMVNDPYTGLDRHLTSWKSPNDPSTGEFVNRIENQGLFQVSVTMGAKKQYRSGHWDGKQFTGLPPRLYQQITSIQDFSSDGRLISIVELQNSSSSIMRLTLSHLGLLQRHIMNEERDEWILAFSEPYDICNRYGRCGPNGICQAKKQPVCDCLRGFVPKYQRQWNVSAWKSGCTRTPPIDCQKEDGFLKAEGIKFPDTVNFQLNSGMSIDECRDECLKNCSCSAYADPYSSSHNACLMWFGDLIDVVEYTGDVTAGPSIFIRVPVSELEHMTDQNKRKQPAKIALVAAAASSGVLVLGLCFGVIIFRRRRKRQAYKKTREEFELPLFSLATIAAATKNFSNKNRNWRRWFWFSLQGEGELSPDQVIAVKRMSRSSGQGPEEFKNEVILIAKLQHINLVRILGCCIEGDEKMLIYEYMQNKSLDCFIFDQNRNALLNWPMRFDIIMGIARGLVYLHHDSRLKIIHRDLKISNILLDESLNAKISDFGLARMFQGNQTMSSTKRVVGTYGYMAPEYVFNGKFSVKSDIFSMGVVILEIVSGKKNRGFNHPCYQNLLERTGQMQFTAASPLSAVHLTWLLWKEGRELELIDPCYECSCVEWQVKRCIQVGLLCVQNSGDERPLMPSVVLMLSTEEIALPEPKKPGFFLDSRSCRSSQIYASGNSVTMSEVEGR